MIVTNTFIPSWLKKQKVSDKDKRKYLLDVTTASLRGFVVFTIDVEDEIAAYNIFQTLNDRGLDLALADLLKVHLFELSGKDSWQDAKERWDEIRSILSQIKVNTFLRHYWLSCEAVVQEKDLLREFQKRIKTKKDAFNFLQDLKDEAEIYEALVNPTSDYWANQEIIDALNDLRILSPMMPLPILMSGSLCLKEGDFIRLIKILTAFIFRYVTIGEHDNKTLEKLLSDTAIGFRDGRVKNIYDVKQDLSKEYVDDETFFQEFSKNEMTAKIAKYTLQKIEIRLSGEQEKFSSHITVEHVLPKKPDGEWRKYLAEQKMDKDTYVNRLGNMTLLLGRTNRKAKNHFFTWKRDEIFSKPQHTKLKLNERLATMQSWTAEDIEDRQKWMAKHAVQIWRIQ